jgi:NAD+ synthase
MAKSDDSAQERLAAHLTSWLKEQVEGSGGSGCVFGLSGGIDSAVVAALCKRAFPVHSLGLIMPIESAEGDAEDARLTAAHFGVAVSTVDLTATYRALLVELHECCAEVPTADRLTCANIKPRLRMTALYAFANHLGYRVIGTGNASELAIGYFTKHGDGGVDLLPLGSLTKTGVRELARHLGVPRRIIDKPPSAGLWDGQTDESEMGLTYDELDAYLGGERTPGAGQIERLSSASRHKRELPPIAPLPSDEGKA